MNNWKILAVLFVILFAGFGIRPVYKSAQTLKAQHTKLTNQKEASLAKLKAEQEKAQQTNQTEKMFISEKLDQSDLIKIVQDITQKAGFSVSNFQFSQGKNTRVGANQVNASFSLSGQRNQILQFLRAVESNQRFLGMKTFGLTTSFKDNTPETTLSVQLYSFYMQ